VAAFQRPLAPVQHHRFITSLFSSLLQVFACLVPVWLAESLGTGPELWRLASTRYLVASFLLGVALIYPLKKLGTSGIITINLVVTVAAYTLSAVVFATHLTNPFLIETPGFELYYASLLAGLGSVFIVFADVATRVD
jgi:hypothetical protein